jgi:hypothetical protein
MRDATLQIDYDSSSPRPGYRPGGELSLQFNLEDEDEMLAGQEGEFLSFLFIQAQARFRSDSRYDIKGR